MIPEYQGNPLIEALPDIWSSGEVINLLSQKAAYNNGERELDAQYRLHCIHRLFRYFQPLEQHIDIEQRISRSIRQGYLERNPILPAFAAGMADGYAAMKDRSSYQMLQGSRTAASGFTIIGVSGVGKSTAVEKILALYPQRIIHTVYRGKMLAMTQLAWLKLDCPHDGSLKQLCYQFFHAVDVAAGTDYFAQYTKGRYSLEMLLIIMTQLVRQFQIGILVIDEIQHLSEAKGGGSDKMLNFFETWVDSINIPAGSESEMISNAVEMIKNTFDIDRVLYISVINGIPVIKYYDSSVDIQQYQLQYIMDFFKKNKRRILVSRLKKSYKFHEEFISAFNRNDLSSLLAIPFYENEEVSDIFIAFKNKRANFTENLSMIYENEADILRTSFRELIEAINREQIKRQLEKSSVTDTLTGIDNRHGLVVKVNKEIERIKRLEKAEELFTILYMDLDNFKFCNDNFGHDAGDAVLVSFSAMLKSIVGEDGIVVRYGGDEFIIIIPNKNVNYGESIANKIFRNIGYNRGFVKAIESTITGKISISDENRITCSIGIASGVVKEYDDISVILKKADKALYAVKNGSKHDYKIWEE